MFAGNCHLGGRFLEDDRRGPPSVDGLSACELSEEPVLERRERARIWKYGAIYNATEKWPPRLRLELAVRTGGLADFLRDLRGVVGVRVRCSVDLQSGYNLVIAVSIGIFSRKATKAQSRNNEVLGLHDNCSSQKR